MQNNVFDRIELGGFFGRSHSWADDSELTIMTSEQLEEFFSARGFLIVDIDEKIKEIETVSHDWQWFHVIEIIAQRVQ